MKAFVIGDRETVLLFAMAGIEGTIVDNQDENEINDEIKRIRKSKEYGLLIVTEKITTLAYDLINSIRFSREHLLIVEVPDKNGHIETGKSLADYIREAVGIRI